MNRTALRILALMACLAGAGMTGVLTADFGDEQTGTTSILTAFCARGDASSSLCAEVVDSRWGSVDFYLGHRRVLVPTSLVGLCYFVAMAIALVVLTPADLASGWLRRGIRFVVAGAVLVSLALCAVMAVSLERWCGACLLSHGVNVILAAIMVALTHGAKEPVGEMESVGDSLLTRGWRAATAGCLASLAALVLLALFDANAAANRAINKAKGLSVIIEGYQSDPNRMLREFYAGPARSVGSPYAVSDKEAPLHVLVFDDISSRASACFERDWAEAFLPVIERPVHVEIRQFPARYARTWREDCELAEDCVTAPSDMPLRAMALLIADDLGGDRAAQAMRGRLLRNKRANDVVELAELARLTGLDPAAFQTRMERRDGLQRIQRDVREAFALGVEQAPAVLVNGRLVPPVCLKSEAFWRAIGSAHDPRNYIPISGDEIETVAQGKS